jgi:transposase-like protein
MTKCVRKNYDVSFKLQVLSDYYLNGLSKNFTCKKWGISFPALLEWLKIWPVEEKELPLLDEIMSRYRMEAENKGKSDEQILQERIAALERSLQMERMRCRALEKVIEIAEREEGISILKKDGVKQ